MSSASEALSLLILRWKLAPNSPGDRQHRLNCCAVRVLHCVILFNQGKVARMYKTLRDENESFERLQLKGFAGGKVSVRLDRGLGE